MKDDTLLIAGIAGLGVLAWFLMSKSSNPATSGYGYQPSPGTGYGAGQAGYGNPSYQYSNYKNPGYYGLLPPVSPPGVIQTPQPLQPGQPIPSIPQPGGGPPIIPSGAPFAPGTRNPGVTPSFGPPAAYHPGPTVYTSVSTPAYKTGVNITSDYATKNAPGSLIYSAPPSDYMGKSGYNPPTSTIESGYTGQSVAYGESGGFYGGGEGTGTGYPGASQE